MHQLNEERIHAIVKARRKAAGELVSSSDEDIEISSSTAVNAVGKAVIAVPNLFMACSGNLLLVLRRG